MNSAWPRRVSLITALGLPTILSPTIGVWSGDARMPVGFAHRDRLRLSLADSPLHADRIEFTSLSSSGPCYGLVVLSPLLSTSHRCDAVTVRYRTALHRTETDFHRSIPSPSQAHERGRPRAQRCDCAQPIRLKENLQNERPLCPALLNSPKTVQFACLSAAKSKGRPGNAPASWSAVCPKP